MSRWLRWIEGLVQGQLLTVLLFLVAMLGIAVIVAHSFGPAVPSTGFAVLVRLLELVFVSAVAATVVNLSQSVGVYNQEIAKIMVERRFVSEFRRAFVVDLWNRLSLAFFLPRMDDGAEAEALAQRTRHRLTAAFASAADRQTHDFYEDEFFLRGLHRVYRIGWHDTGHTQVELEEQLHADLVPFGQRDRVTYRVNFVPLMDNELQSYHVLPKLEVFDPAQQPQVMFDAANRPPAADPAADPAPPSFAVSLDTNGRDALRIRVTTRFRWKLEDDPTFLVQPPYLCDGLTVDLAQIPPDLDVYFLEVGRNLAIPALDQEPSGAPFLRRTTEVVLPGEGFLLVLTRKTPAAAG